MEVITRKQAREQGLSHYFTGKPCKHGHIRERHTVNGACLECRRLRQLKENKEKPKKLASIRAKSYAKNRDLYLAERRKKYWENRENELVRQREWKQQNPECSSSYIRRRRAISPQFAAAARCRARMHDILRKAGATKSAKSWDLIGCGGADLKVAHIESLFGWFMSWENRSDWHHRTHSPLGIL